MAKHSQLFQQASVERDIARGDDLVFIGWLPESLRGDSSLIAPVAHRIGWKLVHEDHISANERIWLALVLAKLREPEIARLVSGSGRGAPKNGLKGQFIAAEVMCSVFDGARSVEDAIAQTAEKKHMSADTVKKHWEKNQEMLWEMYGEVLRELGFADLRDAVSAWTAASRKKGKK
jgi:hypothetical protein